jgi:hypothetical protein
MRCGLMTKNSSKKIYRDGLWRDAVWSDADGRFHIVRLPLHIRNSSTHGRETNQKAWTSVALQDYLWNGQSSRIPKFYFHIIRFPCNHGNESDTDD